MWIIIDIGCIECGESTNVVGLFSSKTEADKIADRLNETRAFTMGQHSYEVFPLPEPNQLNPEYAE